MQVTFLAPGVIRSHLVDVNLLLDYVIQSTGEKESFDQDDLAIFLSILTEIQSHVNAVFPEVEMLEIRLKSVLSSLSFEN